MPGNIEIVGAGIAGLHLALYLQKRGVEATIITDRAPEDYRNIRLLNTVAHHHVTIAREYYLGVNHWTDPKHHYHQVADHAFSYAFSGRETASSVDDLCRCLGVSRRNLQDCF